MLNGVDRTECQKILNAMADRDIFLLKDTVIGMTVPNSTKEDAINIILNASTDVSELLNRKKVTRNMLRLYLITEGAQLNQEWKQKEVVENVCNHIARKTRRPEPSLLTPNLQSTGLPQVSSPYSVASGTTLGPHTSLSNDDKEVIGDIVRDCYRMLNTLHGEPFFSSSQLGFNTRHFWSNCSLLCLFPSEEVAGGDDATGDPEFHAGSDMVVSRLADLVTVNHFVFKLTEGPLDATVSDEGIIKVVASGFFTSVDRMVANLTSCKPIQNQAKFEQLFNLAHDPSDGNRWKIQSSILSVTPLP